MSARQTESERSSVAVCGTVDVSRRLRREWFRRLTGNSHPLTVVAVDALANLYTAWNTAVPGQGYEARVTEWQQKLDAAKK